MKESVQKTKSFLKVENKESAQTITPIPTNNRKFNKITNSLKRSLIRLVIEKNCSIKKAGHILNLSYSSAKAAFFQFKKQSQSKFKGGETTSNIECGYKTIEKSEDTPKLTLCVSTASQLISQKELYFSFNTYQNDQSLFVPEDVIFRSK